MGAIALAAMCALLAAASPAAADFLTDTSVSSQPGGVQVILGHATTHTIEIEESVLHNDQPVPIGFGFPNLPSFDFNEMTLAMVAPAPLEVPPPIPGGPYTPSTLAATLVAAVLILGWDALHQSQSSPDSEEDEEQAKRMLRVLDREGHPIHIEATDPACTHPRIQSADHQVKRLPNMVECHVIPGPLPDLMHLWNPLNLDNPNCRADQVKARLFVFGSPNRDRIALKQHFADSLDCRWIYGGDGSDLIVGSHLADQLIGGTGEDTIDGRDGIDWVRVEDDDVPDTVDCGDPTEEQAGAQGERGDLLDGDWKDLAGMQNCEDVAFSPLPQWAF